MLSKGTAYDSSADWWDTNYKRFSIFKNLIWRWFYKTYFVSLKFQELNLEMILTWFLRFCWLFIGYKLWNWKDIKEDCQYLEMILMWFFRFSFGCMLYKLLKGHSPFRQHKTKVNQASITSLFPRHTQLTHFPFVAFFCLKFYVKLVSIFSFSLQIILFYILQLAYLQA